MLNRSNGLLSRAARPSQVDYSALFSGLLEGLLSESVTRPLLSGLFGPAQWPDRSSHWTSQPASIDRTAFSVDHSTLPVNYSALFSGPRSVDHSDRSGADPPSSTAASRDVTSGWWSAIGPRGHCGALGRGGGRPLPVHPSGGGGVQREAPPPTPDWPPAGGNRRSRDNTAAVR